MERNRKKQKERGITLVALIITIIVMLILVAVTVSIVVESDIITTAEKTAKAKETGELKDQVAMKIGEWQLGKYVEETKDTPLTEYLSKIEGVTVDGTTKIATITKGNTVITVNEKGEMMNSGEVDTWDGTKEIPEIKEGNIYIHNAEQFKYLADSVNGELGEGEEALTITADTTVYLMADIDLGARAGAGTTVAEKWETDANEAKKWTPIGKDNETHQFIGAFEGNGHIIKGAYVSIVKYGGIFGNTTNIIQNLIVKDSYIKATDAAVGGIVGAARSGEILNCHNINTYIIGDNYVGGIAGQSQATIVENCSNSGNINANGTDKQSNAGGIAGMAMGEIQNCSNSGKVTGAHNGVGGIIGNFVEGGLIENCSNDGIIYGSRQSVGGICGYLHDNGVVKMCKNAGPVTGIRNIGGIVGNIQEGTIEKSYNVEIITGTDANIAGICGLIYTTGKIQNTYNEGTIITEAVDASYVGGILADIESAASAEIYNNYNVGTIDIKGTNTTGIGVAIGSIETTGTVNASKNYYLVEELPENHTKTYETPKTEMKSQAFVDELNTGLTEKAWVKTSEYPALIGM